MDVKCTQYVHNEDSNKNDVDVRIFVMQLKPNATYAAKVSPDKNPVIIVTSKTDYEGIFWVVAKIPKGENSELFKVDIYEGNNTVRKSYCIWRR